MSKPSPAHPAGLYRHGLSGTIFRIAASGVELLQEIERDRLKAEYTIDCMIGSGNAALGNLVCVGDAPFQSPVMFSFRQTVPRHLRCPPVVGLLR